MLVHGGFVDGAGWEGVYRILKKNGHHVDRRPESDHFTGRRRRRDEARHRKSRGARRPRGPFVWRSRDQRSGQRREGRRARVRRRVCPGSRRIGVRTDQDPPPGAPVPPILPPQDGWLFLDRAKFAASFAADVDAREGRLPRRLAGSVGSRRARRRGHGAGLEEQAQLVSRRDRRPDDPAAGTARDVAARGSTVVEVSGSHAVYVSQPARVAALIEEAVAAVKNEHS